MVSFLKNFFTKSEPTPKEIQSEPRRDSSLPIQTPTSPALWCPFAIKMRVAKPMGPYPQGYPEGAVIHFTAGRDQSEHDAISTLAAAGNQGLAFFMIGPTGTIYQSLPLDQCGSHAGESAWPGLGRKVSNRLVGIEVACAGQLDNTLTSWFGQKNLIGDCRLVDESHGCPSGWYKCFTDAQETALVDLIKWLKSNNPEVFKYENVLGHHEVSGQLGLGYWRKSDPGGSLSLPMPDFRSFLQNH